MPPGHRKQWNGNGNRCGYASSVNWRAPSALRIDFTYLPRHDAHTQHLAVARRGPCDSSPSSEPTAKRHRQWSSVYMGAGVTMIEILCSDDRQEVRLERVQNRPARIHVGTQHSLEAILDAIGSELTAEEAQACHRLWSDDATGRMFKHIPEGTLFGLTEL